MYFVASIGALFLDTLLGVEVVVPYAKEGMIACFAFGTFLIIWAQITSRKALGHNTSYFFKGPYKYMRNPTHLGLVFLVVGYTLISGSLIFSLVTIVGYLISNIFFGSYEAILNRTYGEEHKHYQSNVPKIL